MADVTDAAGHRYLSHLKKQQLADNSIATAFRCLKAFTRWMYKRGWTERDRFEDVKRPPFVRPKFDTLTLDQKQAMLSLFKSNTFLGARNVAILCVFLDTGIRLEELVHLLADDVHLDQGFMEVYSRKTDDWRIVPLAPESVSVCRHWLKWRDKFLNRKTRERAFPGEQNTRRRTGRTLSTDTFFCSWKGVALTESGVGQMVRRAGQQLQKQGLSVRIHPHLFRHNFLTEKALDGENPSIVRRWAGHKNYQMTDYYFGLAEAKLAAIKPKQSTLAGLQLLSRTNHATRSGADGSHMSRRPATLQGDT